MSNRRRGVSLLEGITQAGMTMHRMDHIRCCISLDPLDAIPRGAVTPIS